MYTRASPTDILARKSAHVGQKSADFVGKLNRPTAVRAAAHEDPHAEVGEEVRVGVVPMEFKLNTTVMIVFSVNAAIKYMSLC